MPRRSGGKTYLTACSKNSSSAWRLTERACSSPACVARRTEACTSDGLIASSTASFGYDHPTSAWAASLRRTTTSCGFRLTHILYSRIANRASSGCWTGFVTGPSPSDGAHADLSIILEEPVEIVGVRREDDRRRSIANGCRGDQRIDPGVGLGEVAQSSGATSGRLVGRLEHGCGALKDAEYAIDLRVASPVARRALDEDRRGHTDRTIVLDDPAQPLSGALRADR